MPATTDVFKPLLGDVGFITESASRRWTYKKWVCQQSDEAFVFYGPIDKTREDLADAAALLGHVLRATEAPL